MAYKYDVFISYKRGELFGKWVLEHFCELFKDCLEQALGRKATVFVDEHNIETGASWPNELRNALSMSTCMVGIWSPRYFDSVWCKYECSVMLYRENRLGYRSQQNPNGLIFPITAHDGDRFPERVREIQRSDFRNFVRTGAGFCKCERYVEFQDEVISFADIVGNGIRNAPQWRRTWGTKQWLDRAIKKFFPGSSTPGFKPPLLE